MNDPLPVCGEGYVDCEFYDQDVCIFDCVLYPEPEVDE